jgi:glutamate racemase
VSTRPAVKRLAVALLGCLALLSLSTRALTGAEHALIRLPSQDRMTIPSKDELTILVTDSGLGGLSIMAEAASRMKQAGVAQKVHLVFVNALFSNESGYNSLRTRDEKIRVFDRALQSMERMVQPDAIVIGCNTLSALYDETTFAKTTRLPVVRIIDPGVSMFRRALEQHPDASLILFGTETTIGEGTHKKALAAGGIAGDRIHSKACPELASYIENNWQGDETGFVIASYVDESLAALHDPKPPVYAGLVCTHYGYAQKLWETAFRESGVRLLGTLNPNTALVDLLLSAQAAGRFTRTEIDARVISMVEISAAKRKSLGGWLERVSPEVAAALARYQLRPDLFEWRSLVTK